MSYPRPPFDTRSLSDQNVRPGRSQSIQEPRTTSSSIRQQPDGDGDRNQSRSEVYHQTFVRGASLSSHRGRERRTERFEPYNSKSRPTQRDSIDYPKRDRERGTERSKPCNTDSRITRTDSREPSTRCNTTKTSEGPLKLCDYCGDVLEETTSRIDNNKVYHDNCIRIHKPHCDRAIKKFRTIINSNDPIVPIGINVPFLYGQKKQDKSNNNKKRAIKIVELLNDVSAVFNSGRGYIFIHFVGLAPGDDFTGAFDEFVDVKLNGLINDGSAFVDVYKKQLLSKHSRPELREFNDILVLTVDSVEFLVTSDAKTKTALDDCIIDTPDQTLLKLLRKAAQFEEQYHQLPIDADTAEDLLDLHESRDIQAKACFQPTERLDKLVSYIFENLKLAKYISAFSKLESGGSYLLGLAEEVYDSKKGEYKSKRLVVKPLVIKDCDQIEAFIKDRLSETVLVCDYSGKELDNKDLIRVDFIPAYTKSLPTSDYVIHVSVRSVRGIVFYEKNGPGAYRFEAGSIRRLSVAEWFEAFHKRIKNIFQ